jgi:hypothetical protein
MPIIETEFLERTKNLDVEAFWDENEHCLDFTTKKNALRSLFFSR